MTSGTDIAATARLDGDRPLLRLRRGYPAGAGRLWRAVSDSEEISTWWAPMRLRLEPRRGGKVTFLAPGEPPAFGEVLEFDEGRTIAFTWDADIVRWQVEPDGDAAVLTLETTVEKPEYLAHCAAGWHTGLRQLCDHLAGQPVRTPEQSLDPAVVEHYRQILRTPA
ncbi:SRPBCC domain-containing protein [Micromonospora profundi]|uniref:SRPBCC domain-containing protein n=1 Tax=Micromonospora profundi TaxID=1420889 RepID=UPI00368C0821